MVFSILSGATTSTVNFRTFSTPQKETPSPLAATLHSPSTPSPKQPLIYCLYGFVYSDILYKWDHTIGGLFCLASFT